MSGGAPQAGGAPRPGGAPQAGGAPLPGGALPVGEWEDSLARLDALEEDARPRHAQELLARLEASLEAL